MTVRWGWGLNLRHDQTDEGWVVFFIVQIFILSFSWQPNKDWKRTKKWFCLGLRMGALEFMIFFYGIFMLNFLGLWIWFLGLWILFAEGFVVDWKMRKSGFELWFFISGFWGLRKSEKICYWVCVCVLAGDQFVFVFGWQERVRKCKKIWTCVLMFKIWVCVLWCSCWRWT